MRFFKNSLTVCGVSSFSLTLRACAWDAEVDLLNKNWIYYFLLLFVGEAAWVPTLFPCRLHCTLVTASRHLSCVSQGNVVKKKGTGTSFFLLCSPPVTDDLFCMREETFHKVTVSEEGMAICWQMWMDLGVNKSRCKQYADTAGKGVKRVTDYLLQQHHKLSEPF